jgi:exodeoxyribonuclease VII small subunit
MPMNARKKADEGAPEEPAFEDALDRLETIVEELEGGSLSLEQSLQHYEEGMKLSKRLGKRLDEAEQSIEKLVEPRDEESGADAGARPRRKPAATSEDDLPDENELPF